MSPEEAEQEVFAELDRRAKVHHGIEPGPLPVEWVRLKGGNDWGNVYFALQPLTDRGMAEFARGIRVKDGERTLVRWDNGDMGETSIEVVRQDYTMGDMGHSYEVTSRVPHVVGSFNGHKVLVRIDQVDVPLDWVIAHSRAVT